MIIRGYHCRGQQILQAYAHLDPYQAEAATVTIPVLPGDELIEVGDELTMEEWHDIGTSGEWTVSELKALIVPKRHVVIPADADAGLEPGERLFYHRVGFRGAGDIVAHEVRDTSDGVSLTRKRLQARVRGEPETQHDPGTFRRRPLRRAPETRNGVG